MILRFHSLLQREIKGNSLVMLKKEKKTCLVFTEGFLIGLLQSLYMGTLVNFFSKGGGTCFSSFDWPFFGTILKEGS